MFANPTHHEGRRPSAELTFANIMFIFNFTRVFNNYFILFYNIKIRFYTSQKRTFISTIIIKTTSKLEICLYFQENK